MFTVKDGKGIKSSLFFLSDQALKEKNVYQLSVEEKKNLIKVFYFGNFYDKFIYLFIFVLHPNDNQIKFCR